ncbi:BON1-associated protein 2-like [Cannabis sativa]|uniref:BON1-associated protein 2-like n=1 Tax=Cannabis sativa TaxID=3483 RepID=UPI0029CAA028|nr:BON1-associated protein 2-like [Cannabis sativa]
MAKIFSSPSRIIEFTILSGENLRIDGRWIKKNSFVIIRPSEGGNDHFRTTEIDTQGGSYPKWNEKLVLELPAQSPAVSIEVYCKTVFGNRLVGVARVPVSDFSGGYVPENYLHFLSYRLRDQKGERNGIVNISVRTKVPLPLPLPLSVPPTPTEYSSCSASAPLVGVPVGNNSFSGGVVTGIPVWCASHDQRRFNN